MISSDTINKCIFLFIFLFPITIWSHTISANAGNGGGINPSGNIQVNDGGSKTFTFYPYYGYGISEVYVDYVKQGAISSYTFNNVTTDHIIQVYFAPLFNINVIPSAGGHISPGSTYVTGGTNFTFNIIPDEPNTIQEVLVDGFYAGYNAITTGKYTFTNVDANHEITAVFRLRTKITASASAGGIISPSGVKYLNPGDNQIYRITPDPGYIIADLKVNGISQTITNIYSINASSAGGIYNISVSFLPYHTITASTVSAGLPIYPSGNIQVVTDSSKTFTISPVPEWILTDVIVDGLSMGPTTSYTFNNVNTGPYNTCKWDSYAPLQYSCHCRIRRNYKPNR